MNNLKSILIIVISTTASSRERVNFCLFFMQERPRLSANRSKYAHCYSTIQKTFIGSALDEQPKVHFDHRYLDDCILKRKG